MGRYNKIEAILSTVNLNHHTIKDFKPFIVSQNERFDWQNFPQTCVPLKYRRNLFEETKKNLVEVKNEKSSFDIMLGRRTKNRYKRRSPKR